MSTNENIQRLREKRKNIEEAYSHSPNRRGSEAIDVSRASSIAQDPSAIGNDSIRSRNSDRRSSYLGNDSGRAAARTSSHVSHDTNRSSTVSAAFSTSILEHIQYLEMKVKDLEGMEGRLKGIEEKAVVKDDHPRYPTDSYSLIALNGPKPTLLWYELWETQRSFYFFLFGMLVFLFQIALYGTMLFGETDMRWGTVPDSGNPDADGGFFAVFIPPNTSEIVKAAQIISLLVYIVFPDSTLQDLLAAYRFFPRCSCSNKEEDPVWMMRFACILKGLQSLCGIATVWFLVMTSSSVFEIILIFTAVNFISDIDDRAYSLAKDGVFGRFLKEETSERISATKLPGTMQRKNDGGYCIVLTSAGLLLIGFLIAMMGAQDSPNRWVTQTLEVTLNDEAFQNFSGCFVLDKESFNFNRYSYESGDASITYCTKNRRWYLLENAGDSETSDDCDSWYSTGIGIARSSETGSFDVSSTYEDTWTSFTDQPLDIKFSDGCAVTTGNSLGMMDSSSEMVNNSLGTMDSSSETMDNSSETMDNSSETMDNSSEMMDSSSEMMDSSSEIMVNSSVANGSVAGDGICDEDLNIPENQYDGGDCCAATCEGPRCGKKILPGAFGKNNSTNTPVEGFPNCKDPDANRRMTIQLNAMGSARRLRDASDVDLMDETPASTYFALSCDGKDVLTGYIEESMVNNAETVMVRDGASCSLVLNNSLERSDMQDNTEMGTLDSSWYVDYTLFHGGKDDEKVIIMDQHINQEGRVDFNLIPECYFEKLENHVDALNIYNTDSGSSSKAIAWLVEDDETVSQCGEADFVERYILAKMNFAMNKANDFINRENHCEWPSISCTGGRVDTIALGYEGLVGGIPSDIRTLTNLKTLDLRSNDISSVPEEIGSLSSLKELDLDGNQLASIPTEIGLLTDLQELSLSHNVIPSLPSEIGLASSLQSLTLAGNKLSSVPTEIGLLTRLETLYLHGNQLSSIPTEIGLMSGLKTLALNGNQLASIPSEIGLLTGLQKLLLFDNNPNLSIPDEIRVLSSSYSLTLYGNDVTCNNLPGEIAAFCFYS